MWGSVPTAGPSAVEAVLQFAGKCYTTHGSSSTASGQHLQAAALATATAALTALNASLRKLSWEGNSFTLSTANFTALNASLH